MRNWLLCSTKQWMPKPLIITQRMTPKSAQPFPLCIFSFTVRVRIAVFVYAAILSSENSNKHLLWLSNKWLWEDAVHGEWAHTHDLGCLHSHDQSFFSTSRWSLTSWHMLNVYLSWSADMQSTQLKLCICVLYGYSLNASCLLLLEKLTQQPLSGLLNFVMLDLLLPGVSSARAP